jgi:hypothetical protein
MLVYCGRTPAEVAHRAQGHGVKSALPPEDALLGPPAQVVDRIGEFAAIGAEVIYLRVDLRDLDHAILLASEVLPQVS